jgi:hypothetical protein
MADARHHPDLPRLERCTLARQGRREGREIRFLCPAHQDQRPSARWNPDKSTWYCDACHQGGGWRDLAERLGLPAPEPAREIAAIYPYRDAAGRLLYEVLRFVPKAFACRRPDPAGWRWNLQGVERVLYRLPELLAAVARGAEIYLTEGEKDADALAALGLEATTHAGGAGKWRPEYNHPLRAARVVLLPDNDEPSHRHMADVEQSLRPRAATVSCLDLPDLPDKGDVSDWLAALRAEGLGDEAIRARLAAVESRVIPWPSFRSFPWRQKAEDLEKYVSLLDKLKRAGEPRACSPAFCCSPAPPHPVQSFSTVRVPGFNREKVYRTCTERIRGVTVHSNSLSK